MPEGTAVITFSIPHPRINSCASEGMSFRKPTSSSAEEGFWLWARGTQCFQAVPAAGQPWLLGFIRLIACLMKINLILPSSRVAAF